jgi:hypothetical protein
MPTYLKHFRFVIFFEAANDAFGAAASSKSVRVWIWTIGGLRNWRVRNCAEWAEWYSLTPAFSNP